MDDNDSQTHRSRSSEAVDPPVLGLRANFGQFGLLVLVNGFVGGMVGMERSILPSMAEEEFGLVARTAILSFIVVFGLSKAAANYFAGRWADAFGRKRILIAGWIVAIPVPFALMWAPTWEWVLAANVLLGVSQGLTWSTTVIMKIDLVGSKGRGLAMGINESAGYVAVALAALATGWIAGQYGLRPEPFYLGIAFVLLGLCLSILLVRDTRQHVILEARSQAEATTDVGPASSVFRHNGHDTRTDRRACRDLSGCLGYRPVVHRRSLRSSGAQGAHRRGHVSAGRWDRRHRHVRALFPLCAPRRFAGGRHRDGLSDLARGHRRCGRSGVAGLGGRCLQVMARSGVRYWRGYRRGCRRCFWPGSGDLDSGRVDLGLRFAGGGSHD